MTSWYLNFISRQIVNNSRHPMQKSTDSVRLLERPPVSVNRKMANYQWLDPTRQGGLSSASEQSRSIWDEFAHNERRLKITSKKCRRVKTESVGVVTDSPNCERDVESLHRIIELVKSDPKLSPENAEILSDIVKTYYQRLASQ